MIVFGQSLMNRGASYATGGLRLRAPTRRGTPAPASGTMDEVSCVATAVVSEGDGSGRGGGMSCSPRSPRCPVSECASCPSRDAACAEGRAIMRRAPLKRIRDSSATQTRSPLRDQREIVALHAAEASQGHWTLRRTASVAWTGRPAGSVSARVFRPADRHQHRHVLPGPRSWRSAVCDAPLTPSP